jgi:hypothetical protein
MRPLHVSSTERSYSALAACQFQKQLGELHCFALAKL